MPITTCTVATHLGSIFERSSRIGLFERTGRLDLGESCNAKKSLHFNPHYILHLLLTFQRALYKDQETGKQVARSALLRNKILGRDSVNCLMETMGLEPTTSGLQSRRSPS